MAAERPDGGHDEQRGADDLEAQLSHSAASSVAARDDGSLDIMASVGGIRGLIEATLPAAAFLVTFLLTEQLGPSLIVSVVLGVVFAAVRLVQRGSLVQSVSGLVGILICAWVAHQSGEARDFYLWGFITNAVYVVGFIATIAFRVPFLGLVFGLVRGEGFAWRHDRLKRRRYALATWIIVAVMLLRLAVQYPLYLAGDVAALGTARLVMGVPLYALALWVAWMITRDAVLGKTDSDAAQRGSR